MVDYKTQFQKGHKYFPRTNKGLLAMKEKMSGENNPSKRPEARAKISKARKGNNGKRGLRQTEETKKKISLSHKGKKKPWAGKFLTETRLSNMEEINYKEKAKKARLKILDMIYFAQSSHIGSNFSAVDILTVLFDKLGSNDKVILSAGWKAASFYYFLKQKGYDIDLDSYCKEGSKLIGLTEPGIPGVLFAGGSMQMGLPAAVGFALSKKMKGEEGMVYCIVSDGELAGGMIWESLLIADCHKLNNLSIIVDNNGFQAMGKVENILSVPALNLGYEVDGHDHERISTAISHFNENTATVHIFKTVKGKGVSFMENNNLYHYKNLSEDEYLNAKAELNG